MQLSAKYLRRAVAVACLIAGIGILLYTARNAFFPPSTSALAVYDQTRIELQTSRKFIWSYGDCVTVQWQTANAVNVYFNGQAAPANGQREYCVSEAPPIRPEEAQRADWNFGGAEYVYTTVSQYPDIVVMARVHDDIDTFLHISEPIYVLAADGIWLWHVALALGLLYASAHLSHLAFAKRTSRRVISFARRNNGLLTLSGVCIAVIVVLVTQTSIAWLVLSNLATLVQENGFAGFGIAGWSFIRGATVLLSFGVAAMLLGTAALQRLDADMLADSPLGFLAVAWVLGQGLLSFVFVCLAIFNLLTLSTVTALLVLSVLVGLPHLPQLSGHTRQVSSAAWRVFISVGVGWKILLVLSFVMLLFPLMRVFTEINWDGHTTYMTQAKLIAITGGVSEPARDFSLHYTASGFVGEAKIGAVFLLAGDVAARVHSWLVYLSIVLAGLALSSALKLSQRGRIIALVALVTSSLLYGMVGWGKVDGYAFAPALAAILLTLHLADNPRTSSALVIGFLAGLAVIAKITYLPTLGVLLLSLTVFLLKPGQLPRLWSMMVLGALLPIGALVLRNALVLGEPFLPLLSLSPTPETLEIVQADARGRLLRQLYAFYPLTWYGSYSSSTLVYLTPLWLIMFPLTIWRLFSADTPRLQRVLLGCTVASYLVWAFVFDNILPLRYQAALLVVFLIMGAEGLAVVIERSRKRLIRFSLVFGLFFAFVAVFSTELAVIGNKLISPVARYDCRPSPRELCEGMEMLNSTAAPNSRVLTNLPLYYYLRDDLLLCRGEKADHLALLEQPAEARWDYLHRNGFNYVVDWRLDGVWHQASRQYLQMYPVVPLNPADAPEALSVVTVFESEQLRIHHIQAQQGTPAADCLTTPGQQTAG